MINFPVGFDINLFVSEVYTFAAPFVAVFFLIGVWILVTKILNRV